MAKEVLTQEMFLQDYKDKIRNSHKAVIGFLICLTCILVLLILATIHIYGVGFAFYGVVFFDAMVAFYIYLCMVALISGYKNCQNIKLGLFYVVTDELIGKEEPETYPGIRFLNTFSKPAELKFYAYGTFIPVSNHTSNDPDLHAISDADNYICSSVGDKFLLVISKKSHILLAYNTKLFEYHV